MSLLVALLNRPGYYGRLTNDVDARAAYNHLHCAPSLLWLAEALREDAATLSGSHLLPGRTAGQTVAAWMGSPDHCGSLMRSDRTTGGLGRFDTTRSDRAAVFTVVGDLD